MPQSLSNNPAVHSKFAELRYKPWGEVRWSSGAMPTDRRFTGMMTHAGLGGLVTMGVREYLPSLGRWLSADTIVPRAGDPQAFNRFSYVRNSPIGRIDPSGHGDCNSHQKPRCNGEGIEKPAFANSRKVHTLKAGIIDRAHVELFRTKALEILTFVRGAIGWVHFSLGGVKMGE